MGTQMYTREYTIVYTRVYSLLLSSRYTMGAYILSMQMLLSWVYAPRLLYPRTIVFACVGSATPAGRGGTLPAS